MKLRSGFVSNSSSSSFVCDVCGREESGWDIGLEECEMTECKNEHTFCDEHKIEGHDTTIAEKRIELLACKEWTKKEVTEMDDDEVEENFENYCEDTSRYEASPLACPICQFINATDRDLAAYYLKKAGVKREEISGLLKQEFGDYQKLAKFIKHDK